MDVVTSQCSENLQEQFFFCLFTKDPMVWRARISSRLQHRLTNIAIAASQNIYKMLTVQIENHRIAQNTPNCHWRAVYL